MKAEEHVKLTPQGCKSAKLGLSETCKTNDHSFQQNSAREKREPIDYKRFKTVAM